MVEIEEVEGDVEAYPFYFFKFTQFNNIDEKSPGTIIGNCTFKCISLQCRHYLIKFLDVIGYVLSVEDPEKVPNSASIKRRVTIIDEFDREVAFHFSCCLCHYSS